MEYTVALSVAAKAATYLQENEGSMSETEMVVHISVSDILPSFSCR